MLEDALGFADDASARQGRVSLRTSSGTSVKETPLTFAAITARLLIEENLHEAVVAPAHGKLS